MRSSMIVLGLCALLVSCSQPPPVAVDSNSVESQLYWSRALQNKRVAVEGYINFDNGPDGQAIAGGPELRTSPRGTGEKVLSFTAEFGSGPNQIGSATMRTGEMFKDAPKGVPQVVTFDPETLTFQDAQGSPHPISQQVKVTGRLKYAVSVEDDRRSPTGQRFRPFLTQVVLEPVY